MNFLNPIALLLGLCAALIVLMYLLKLRRKREDFSSTLLWMKSVEDLTANAPFQKLRQNLLMYLQILFLLLLVAALARPTLWLSRVRGLSRVILIDNTASMNATDGPNGESRLEQARRKARELIDNMRQGDEAMVMSFGGAVQVGQSFTPDKNLLAAAVRRIEPTDAPPRIREAITMAKGVITGRPSGMITLIGDGGQGYLGNLLGEKDPVEFVAVGASDANCGIVAFDLRESFETRGEAQVFAEIENFSAKPAEVLARCLLDGEVIQTREEAIEGRGRKGFVFSGLKGDARRLLRLELLHDDALATDNVVQGFVDLQSQARVLLVSKGNFFLEKSLGLLPGARVAKIAPEDYEPSMTDGVVVFDQIAPKQIGPGRYLFIGATPPLDGFVAAPEPVKNAVMLDWNRLHPVTRFLDLDGLAFTEVLKVVAPDWVTPLAESDRAALVLAGERQGVRLVVVPFDIYASDWPMRVSFPLFVSNAIGWLAGEARGSLSGSHPCGATIALPATAEVTVTDPAGRRWTCQPDQTRQAYFSETHRVGLYRASGAGGGAGGDAGSAAGGEGSPGGAVEQQFAVNLLSPAESDIAPKSELIGGERKVTAVTVSKENREIWMWVALAALGFLALEWHIYCRRAWL